ncbi:MAG: hypothetical protein KIG36_05325, partial [Eubacteriales bacterium]|nr:hypothetical protein [Eubacteriales bacterium]
MKKAMTLIRFLACAALTVVLLAGCTVAPTPTGTETPAPGPSDAPTVTIPDSYTVVRAFSSGGETLTAIRDLADALTAMSGDGFRLVTEVNAETDAEIIIGPAAHHGAYERCRAMEDETWSV